MHSTFWYLLSLEADAPTGGAALLDHCTDVWLRDYEHILDENNWYQPLYCAEEHGSVVKHPELGGEPADFSDSMDKALLAVAYSLSMYARSSGQDFLDINPLSIGPRGEDESLVGEMDSEQLKELLLRLGAKYLRDSYQVLLDGTGAKDSMSLSDFQRSAFARRYELFCGSISRPFSDEYPSPYVYPCADLRLAGSPRQAILAVDIHT